MTERDTQALALPSDIHEAESLEIAASKLGAALGLDAAAPEAATRKALDDALYARALWASRNVPTLRDHLLGQPEATRMNASAPSTGALVKQAVGSVLKWGMEGLKPAEPWVIERRLKSCNACPFQAPAPDTLIYRGAKVVVGKDSKICTSCHCLTNTKAAISTEHCPERDPGDPALSRWGEPWLPPEEHPKGPW